MFMARTIHCSANLCLSPIVRLLSPTPSPFGNECFDLFKSPGYGAAWPHRLWPVWSRGQVLRQDKTCRSPKTLPSHQIHTYMFTLQQHFCHVTIWKPDKVVTVAKDFGDTNKLQCHVCRHALTFLCCKLQLSCNKSTSTGATESTFTALFCLVVYFLEQREEVLAAVLRAKKDFLDKNRCLGRTSKLGNVNLGHLQFNLLPSTL